MLGFWALFIIIMVIIASLSTGLSIFGIVLIIMDVNKKKEGKKNEKNN